MVYGWSIETVNWGISGTWFETIGYVVIAMLGLGALLENRRTYPLLKKEIMDALQKYEAEDPIRHMEFLDKVENDGLESALKQVEQTSSV